MQDNEKQEDESVIGKLTRVISKPGVRIIVLLVIVATLIVTFKKNNEGNPILAPALSTHNINPPLKIPVMWVAPDTSGIAGEANEKDIRYGYNLVSNTAFYLGPKGKVARISNGMNCQNCHLNAGSKPFGNNYSAVASTYPKFRERSGKVESVSKRVNDCFERSLNGQALDTVSKEMRAIIAYINWLGKKVPKGVKPAGAGITDLAFMSRAADPANGKILYMQKCKSCHTATGAGVLNANGITYQYPPLWGEHSYNIGAGLYRLSRFAGYIKSNMPFGASYDKPQLTDEEAWDIAAFVNSQERPALNVNKDFPNRLSKPVDYPFGPYADGFSEAQHKYGPFEPMKKKEKIK